MRMSFMRDRSQSMSKVSISSVWVPGAGPNILADVNVLPGGIVEADVHPSCDEDDRQLFPIVASGIICRALAILAGEPGVQSRAVPQIVGASWPARV